MSEYPECIEGKFVMEDGVIEACVCVNPAKGLVERVWKGACLAGLKVLRFSRNKVFILPGLIDMHVHLRGLELSYKEDELSGTLAAAHGGFTLVLDMPNTKPELRTYDALRLKLASLFRNAVVDYGVYIGLTSLNELEKMIKNNAVAGLKLYPEDLAASEDVLRRALEIVAKHGKIIVLHPEHPSFMSESCGPGERWRCRPVTAEIEAIRLLRRVSSSGTKIHITHVTTALGIDEAHEAGFTADVTPHHLLLDAECEAKYGCIAKVNPPLRPEDVRQELFLRFAEGNVDVVATDHAPHAVEEKMKPFFECPPGIPSLDYALSLLLTLVNKGVIDLVDLARMLSWSPARILGLHRYGCIVEGCIASYTVVDLDVEGRVLSSEFFSKAKYTPFEGFRYRGAVRATVVRGQPVYIDGCVCVKPGYGVSIGELLTKTSS